MKWNPEDAPANSETEAVAENVSEETGNGPADATNTGKVEEVGVPEGTGIVCEGNTDLSADAVTEKEPVLDEAEKEETLKATHFPWLRLSMTRRNRHQYSRNGRQTAKNQSW